MLVISNFSFSHSVFERLVSKGRQKVSLCGNGLNNINSHKTIRVETNLWKKTFHNIVKMEKVLVYFQWDFFKDKCDFGRKAKDRNCWGALRMPFGSNNGKKGEKKIKSKLGIFWLLTHFLLFPTCFFTLWTTNWMFIVTLSSANAFNLVEAKILLSGHDGDIPYILNVAKNGSVTP